MPGAATSSLAAPFIFMALHKAAKGVPNGAARDKGESDYAQPNHAAQPRPNGAKAHEDKRRYAKNCSSYRQRIRTHGDSVNQYD